MLGEGWGGWGNRLYILVGLGCFFLLIQQSCPTAASASTSVFFFLGKQVSGPLPSGSSAALERSTDSFHRDETELLPRA